MCQVLSSSEGKSVTKKDRVYPHEFHIPAGDQKQGRLINNVFSGSQVRKKPKAGRGMVLGDKVRLVGGLNGAFKVRDIRIET